MNSTLRIIVTGLIAQHRLLGGVAWGVLNWIIGLTRLGHDVYYIEDSGQWPYNMNGGPSGDNWVAMDCRPNVEHLNKVMSQFGLADKWCYRFPIQDQWYGLSESKRTALLETADLLLNVSGTLEHPEHYRHVPRLIYIDTDPAFTQIGVVQDVLKKRVDAHDVHFTFGECLEDSFSDVPVTGHHWHAIRTPIPLSEWRTSVRPRNVFTTVMNWTSYKPLSYGGKTYGQKDIEFIRFLDLPEKVKPTVLEVALPKFHHKKWAAGYINLPQTVRAVVEENPGLTPHDLLAQFGWRVVDALEVGADFNEYREYIRSSGAEWSIAKNGYVRGRTGWFSNRSATYLAAGRPVVVQDTGFTPVLPVGEGILTFKTIDEAVDSIQEVEGNYRKHSAAALSLAHEYFDSDKVLNQLLEVVYSGTGYPTSPDHC